MGWCWKGVGPGHILRKKKESKAWEGEGERRRLEETRRVQREFFAAKISPSFKLPVHVAEPNEFCLRAATS